MLSLHQKLALQQKLSPQQIQYQKLLQLNTLSLEQRIKTELELNPILEETFDEEMEMMQRDSDSDDSQSDTEDEIEINQDDEFDIEDFMNDSDLDSDRINKSPDDDDDIARPVAPARKSLREKLFDQLHEIDMPEKYIIAGEFIIDSLDADGYFKVGLEKIVNDMNMFEDNEISIEETEKVLLRIQRFEPIGIAARSLQECLLIQIKYSSFDPYYSYLAEQIILNSYEDFVNKRFENIEKALNLNRTTLKSAIDIISRLNPKPGEGNIDNEQANQITPDFIIEKVGTNFVVTLNDRSLPSVTISQQYLEMLDSNKRKRKISERERDTHKFLREKFESAKWFMASILQRRDTLMKIMQAILEKQYEFFEYGPKALRPMIYKDIADEIMMDISTISRVVNGKYVQSPVGIHELKYFFSEGLTTDSGREVSNKHIKELIKEICDGESKKNPYSDDKIAEILQAKGIHIARRTVAKYREQMMIPVARLRKEI